VKPVLQALLLADHVYKDANTGKMIVAGTFNRLGVFKKQEQEAAELAQGEVAKTSVAKVQQAGSPYAYINIIEVHGSTAFELRYVDLDSHEVIFHTSQITVEAKDPLTTFEVAIPLPPLPARLGVYALELVWQSELLGSYRIVVAEV